MEQSATRRFERMGAAMQGLRIQIGAALAPAVEQLLVSLTPLLTGLSKWIDAHPKLTAGIIGVVAALGALATVLGPPIYMLGMLQVAMVSSTGGTTLLSRAVLGLAASLKGLFVGLLASLQGVLASFLLVKIAIGAIVFGAGYKLGQWLYEISGKVQVLRDAFDGLGDGVFRVYNALSKMFGGGVKSVEYGAKYNESVARQDTARAAAIDPNDVRGAFGLPALASGGIAPGGLALVGERGPELVNLPRGAQVHSNADSQRMMGGNVSINVNMNGVTVREQADVGRIARELGRRVDSRLMARGLRPLTA